jgi:PPOX class probable F420-dependent enzyme
VRLDEKDCWARLDEARHAVLATRHPGRGVDAVPVVFAIVSGVLVLPIDTVKPKRDVRLTRLANLADDARCVLLAEHYSDDWAELWWVRVHATAEAAADPASWVEALADRYPPYRAPGAVVGIVILRPTRISGWQAG